MKVRDAIRQLSMLPQDLELMDEYAENEVSGFHVAHDDTEYVMIDMIEVV
jgi:hypothetical protein